MKIYHNLTLAWSTVVGKMGGSISISLDPNKSYLIVGGTHSDDHNMVVKLVE